MDPLFSVDRRMAYIVGHELLLQSVHENINALKPATMLVVTRSFCISRFTSEVYKQTYAYQEQDTSKWKIVFGFIIMSVPTQE